VTERLLVSVLLPCFEAEGFVAAALDSLLGQTYRELEILAIDDASGDGTLGILEAYADRDGRIRVLRNERNLGLIATLNRGVAEARGELIARMDADDVAAAARIERQVETLERRPDVGVVGTAIEVVGRGRGRSLGPRPVRCTGPGGARFAALLVTPVVHATILARAPVMRAHPYGSSLDSLHAEDYEMFARMLEDGVGFGNLDETLLAVRANPDSVSLRHERMQVDNFVACAARHLERTLGLRPDPGAHRVMVNRMDGTVTGRHLESGLDLLDRVERAFLDREPGAAGEIRRCADMQRVDVLVQATLKAPAAVKLRALGLALRNSRRLLSPGARGYIASKLRPSSRSGSRIATARLAPQGSR
jgi:glycosyltransferase involved in cell wall biosynthesis